MNKQSELYRVICEIGVSSAEKIRAVAVDREVLSPGEDATAFLKILLNNRLVQRKKMHSFLSGRKVWHYWKNPDAITLKPLAGTTINGSERVAPLVSSSPQSSPLTRNTSTPEEKRRSILPRRMIVSKEHDGYGRIYLLADPRHGDLRCYVGQTWEPLSKRFNSHLGQKNGNLIKQRWMNELKRLCMAPTISCLEIIQDGPDSRAALNELEMEWISRYDRSPHHISTNSAIDRLRAISLYGDKEIAQDPREHFVRVRLCMQNIPLGQPNLSKISGFVYAKYVEEFGNYAFFKSPSYVSAPVADANIEKVLAIYQEADLIAEISSGIPSAESLGFHNLKKILAAYPFNSFVHRNAAIHGDWGGEDVNEEVEGLLRSVGYFELGMPSTVELTSSPPWKTVLPTTQ